MNSYVAARHARFLQPAVSVWFAVEGALQGQAVAGGSLPDQSRDLRGQAVGEGAAERRSADDGGLRLDRDRPQWGEPPWACLAGEGATVYEQKTSRRSFRCCCREAAQGCGALCFRPDGFRKYPAEAGGYLASGGERHRTSGWGVRALFFDYIQSAARTTFSATPS